MTAELELVCLDMAGTTVADDGRVLEAFRGALEEVTGRPPTDEEIAVVRATMGQSKIEVFTRLTGDEDLAKRATAAFEAHYEEAVRARGITEIQGASALLHRLHDQGIRVVLTTGFSARTQSLLIETLGWAELIDDALCPTQELRGRPYPDMLLAAALHARVTSLAHAMSVRDTPMDARAGAAARLGRIVGVLTGGHAPEALLAAGATDVIDSIKALSRLLPGSDPSQP